MQMPSVSFEMKRLTELFAGTWRGEEKLYASEWDPTGGPATGVWNVRPGVDGFCLLVDYEETRDGKVAYRGHGVHGFDAKDQCFYVYWFDNIGMMPKTAVRAALHGDHYGYEERSPMGQTRMSYAWKEDVFTFTIEKSKDGTSWAPMHEGTYRRA